MPPDVRAEFDRIFAPQKPDVSISNGQAQRLGSASISGRVLDDRGVPLPGVRVVLELNGIQIQAAVSGNSGNFRFANIATGTYSLNGSIAGFNDQRHEGIRVSASSQIQLNLIMTISLAEQFTVLGESPIVDVKNSSALDPWAVVDQQTYFDSDGYENIPREYSEETVWNYDGVRDCKSLSDELRKSRSDLNTKYVELRINCFSVKKFYLESAEFFSVQDSEFSLRVLMDAVEFIQSDPGMYRTVARKLQSWQKFELAEKVLMKAVQSAPSEPHNRFELAHLYALLGKIAKAKTELKSILESPELLRYQGLQEIISSELSRLESTAEGVSVYIENDSFAGLSVILSWDTNYSDLDLHVVEPTGEVVNYSQTSSAAGGKFFADNTAGYGPEIYTITKPRSGNYKIRIRYYSSDATSISQSTTATVTIYQKDTKGEFVRQEFTVVFTGQSQEFDVGTVRVL
jgi:hypothetical protein